MGKSKRTHFYLFWFCVYMAILFTNMLYLEFDSDILWHYKLGEEILQTGVVSTFDTFSWQPGLRWVNYEWLYDVLLYLIVHYTDLFGFTVIFSLNVFLFLFGGAFFSKAKSKLLFVICASAMYWFTPTNHGNRPGEFSIWFLVLAVYLFRSSLTLKKKCLCMFGLGVLVANFHGGSIVTIAILWLILVVLDIIWDVREKIFKVLPAVVRSMPLMFFLAGTVINPAGFFMHYVSIKVPFAESTKHIEEWQQTEFNYLIGFLFIVHILVFGYQIGKRGFERELCKDVGLFCAAAMLGITAYRGCAVYLFLWVIYGYKYLEDAVFDFFPNIRPFKMRPSAIVMAVFVVLFGPTCVVTYPEDRTFEAYAMEGYANETADVLKGLGEIKLFNGYSEGNFLLFRDVKCFLDSRQSPYMSEVGNGSLDELLACTGENFSLKKFEDYFIETGFGYVYSHDAYTFQWCFEESELFELYYENMETGEKIYKVIY